MRLIKQQMEISEPLTPTESIPQPDKMPVISGVTVEQNQPLKEPETFTPSPPKWKKTSIRNRRNPDFPQESEPIQRRRKTNS